MSNKKLYYGDFNNNISEKLFNKALASLKKGENEKFIYILPNRKLLTKYRASFVRELGYGFKVNLYTFDDLVEEILSEDIEIIEEEIKELILFKIVRSMSLDMTLDKFKDFENMEGFITSISHIIGDIKRSLIRSDQLVKNDPKLEYFDEISTIYKEYEAYLEREGLFDIEEVYFKAIELLKEEGLKLDGLDYIIIDNFYDFRPIELYLLEELSKSEIEIHINVPFRLGDIDLIDKNLKRLEEIGFKRLIIDKEEKNSFEILGSSMFSSDKKTYNFSEEIKLFRAASPYLEIRAIFQDIKSKILKGNKPEDIAIVIANDQYLDLIKDQAWEEKIRISQSYNKNLLEQMFIRELLNLLRIGEEESFKQIVLKRIRSKYFNPLDKEYRDMLYADLRSNQWNDMETLNKVLEPHLVIENGPSFINKFLSRLKIEVEAINSCRSILDFNNFIREMLDYYKVRERLIEESSSDIYILKERGESLKLLDQSLEELDMFSDLIDDLDFRKYYSLILDNFSSKEIELRPAFESGVQVLNLINMRGIKYKYVYIPGLSQSNYPKLENINFFMKEDNKKELKNIGISIRDYKENLENEMVKFRIALSQAEEGIILSYSREGDGIASVFLDEILRLSDGIIESKDIEYDYILKEEAENIGSYSDLETYILTSLRNGNFNIREYLGAYNIRYPGRLERINSKKYIDKARQDGQGEYMGEIVQDDVIKDMEEFNKDRIYSSSYLESYAICPYRFLMDRIFKVEDIYEKIEGYDPIKLGNLYHDVLYSYYSYHKESLANPESFDFEKSLSSLEEIFSRRIKILEFDSDKTTQLMLDMAYRKLVNFIEKDLERIEKDGLSPYEFEKTFGRYKDFYLDDDGDKMYITGIIDRIDKTEDGKLFVMDYKSGSSGVYKIDDIKSGLGIQIPLYILSQGVEDVAAGLYGQIGSGKFQQAMVKSDSSKYANRIRAGKMEEEEWTGFFKDFERYILSLKRGINLGNFRIDPKECPSYCIYGDICRYDEKVEI